MFEKPFDNTILIKHEYNDKVSKIIQLYTEKLTTHLDNVEK